MNNQILEQFIKLSALCENLLALDREYTLSFERLNIECFSHSYYSGSPDSISYQHSVSSRFLQSWHERFIQEDYEKVDEIGQKVRSSILPVTWNLAEEYFQAKGRLKTMFSEALDFGLRTGISIPYFDANKEVSILVVHDKNIQQRFINTPSHHFLLHQLGMYYHHNVARLLPRSTKNIEINLTARELECLILTSQQQTAKKIAAHLGISARTVGFHIENANKKLNTLNKHESVRHLIKMGVISP